MQATINIPGGIPLTAGTYWLNLQTATATSGPVGWDENNGPSLASQNTIGTIGSEDPDIYGPLPVPPQNPAASCCLALACSLWQGSVVASFSD